MTLRGLLVPILLCLAAARAGAADLAPFDLAGPDLQVTVTRAGRSLPLAQVPNLSPGDLLAIKADLPADQSARYLMVVAFLRGATNPPPEKWFFRDAAKDRKDGGGLTVTVPEGAQQAMVLLAPRTGGDYRTLVGAVRGRPGAFVRAAQDLNQASLDRSRLDAYLDGIRRSNATSPDKLAKVAPHLARSLVIKLNAECLQKMVELQAACLMQNQDTLVLNDGHSRSITDILTSGAPADLAFQLSATPEGGFGYYSPYIGAIRDIVGILGSFRTAHFQYIPALGVARGDRLALLLNAAPSFHNPKSVLMAALPAIQPSPPPPLHAAGSTGDICIERPDPVLPVEGAPLIYSTRYAHDMVLRLRGQEDQHHDFPVRADAARGGYVLDGAALDATHVAGGAEAVLHGDWGFQPFDGPRFHLQTRAGASWRLAADDQDALIVGRDDTVHLEGGPAACVEQLILRQRSAADQTLSWTSARADQLTVTLPLAKAKRGAMSLLVRHFGDLEPKIVPLQAYEQAGQIEDFTLHAGDVSGVLTGSRLDQVSGLTIGGLSFKPAGLSRAGGADRLTLDAEDPAAVAKLEAGAVLAGKAMREDGRGVGLKVTIAPARPRVTLIARTVDPVATQAPVAIRLLGVDQTPRGARLTFSLRAGGGLRLTGKDTVEVATLDGTASTSLTSANGYVREDAQVAVVTLDPGRAFDPSTFGPLRFRLVQDGVAGDWQPLTTLVRLPSLRSVTCPADARQGCELEGGELFLIDSIAGEPGFAHPVAVPEGFTASKLHVPRPVAGKLYVKLRDDRQLVNEIVVKRGP